MMKHWKHIPLVIFTLLTPGIVFSYLFNYQPATIFLLWHLMVGGIGMFLASFHLRKPTVTPQTLRNVRSSWFSREAVAFSCFFSGLGLQLFFSALRAPLFWIVCSFFGLLGVLATIMVYVKTHTLSSYNSFTNQLRYKEWPIFADILAEGLFISSVILLFIKALGPNQGELCLIIGISLKLIKDVYLGIVRFSLTRNGFWLVLGCVSLIGILFITTNTILLKPITVLMLISSIVIRLTFFVRLEEESLKKHVNDLRKSYLPEKYRQYF